MHSTAASLKFVLYAQKEEETDLSFFGFGFLGICVSGFLFQSLNFASTFLKHIKKMRWERLLLKARPRETPEGKKTPGRKGGIFGPEKRWGHTCNSVRGGRHLYVFGGYGKDRRRTNDVHIFDTTKKTWSKPVVKGNPPCPRDSHSCTTIGINLFVFGGTDGMVPLKDLHVLDTSTNTWITPSVRGEGPEAREGHGAALFGKNLFIFGGCGKSRNNPVEVHYNNLYILDTDALVWRRAITSGIPPSPRCSHTCSSSKNKMIVVSGEDASDDCISDVHILDTDTLVWRELCTSGDILPPRAGHSAVSLGKYLFVFGGFTDNRSLYDDFHMLDVDTGVWIKVVATGEGPCARFSVAVECINPRKGVIVFIGGCNALLEALDDMYYLHTDISMENGQDVRMSEKVSIRKELKRKCQVQYLPVSLPVNNRDVPQLGTSSAMCRTMPLPSYNQAANKKLVLHESSPSQDNRFEAKVTESFPHGYTVETTIGGKDLRGILFSVNPPGFDDGAANTYLPRQSTGQETGHSMLNGRYKSKLETARRIRKKAHHTKKNAIHGKESASQESPLVTTLVSNPGNSPPADVSQSHMIPKIVLPAIFPRHHPSVTARDALNLPAKPQMPQLEGPPKKYVHFNNALPIKVKPEREG